MYYGWYIVVASSIIMGYNSLLFIYGFTTFVNPILSTFGWTYTQVSLAISVRSITAGVLYPFMGVLVDRWPARRLLLIGSIVVGLGYLTLSKANSLALFYAGYIVIGLGGSLAIQLVPQTSVARWFHNNLGKANGFMGFSIALGGVAIPLLVKCIDNYGWQNTFFFAAVGTWIMMIPLSFLFRNRPEDYGLAPDGIQIGEEKEPNNTDVQITGKGVKETLKTRTFWLIGIGIMIQSGCSFALLGHMMPHFIHIGMERSHASLIVMTVALVGLAARVPIGWLMDITSRRNVIALSIGLSSISFFLIWLIKVDSPFILVLAFAIPFGIGNGSIWVRSAIIREYFGVKSFGAISGLISTFTIIGSSVFPATAGLVFDTMGDYGPAFLSFSALNMVGALLTLAIPRFSNKISESVEYPIS